MLRPLATFLLSALIAHCVADDYELNLLEVATQQVPDWMHDLTLGEQLSETHVELVECIKREKCANKKMELQKTSCEKDTQELVRQVAYEKSEKNRLQKNSNDRLALLQQNASNASSNAENLLEKWQTCESRINSSATAGANKTSLKSTPKLIHLSTGYYYISNVSQKANWYMASTMCKSYGMELASVETKEENDALMGAIAMMKEDFHISGTDLGSEGKFYWASTGEPFGSFNNWTMNGHVNPNNAGNWEHCVHYWYFTAYGEKHTWNDAYCYGVKRFICELME